MARHQSDPIVIPYEDDLTHSNESPFCPDGSCLCHEDQEHIERVLEAVGQGLLTPEEATQFVSGKMV